MTTLDVLRKARAMVAKGWTQGAFARNAKGYRVHEDSKPAVCWCPIGGIFVAIKDEPARLKAVDALRKTAQIDDCLGLVIWNDTKGRTQAEVLDLFDRAIAAEERKQEENRV